MKFQSMMRKSENPQIVNGDVKTIKDDLTSKMNEASRKTHFEKAMDYRDH